MDGRYITEARTAAVSAASAKHLARQDARVLAVLGSGVQARSHIDALTRVRPFEEIRVWGRDAGRGDGAAERRAAARAGAPRSPPASAEAAARSARTSSRWSPRRASRCCGANGSATARTSAPSAPAGPISARWTRALVRDARVFVDSRAGALAEAGDLVIPIQEGAIDASHIAGELGDVFGGRDAGTAERRRDHDLQVAGDGGRGRGGRAPGVRTSVGARPGRGFVLEVRGCDWFAVAVAVSSMQATADCQCNLLTATANCLLRALLPLGPALLHHLGHALPRFGRHLAAAALAAGRSGNRCRLQPAATAATARPAFEPTRLRSCAACAVSAASLFRVSAISRSIPPSAQPISSADRISTSSGFLRGLPLGIYPLREPCGAASHALWP